ncbi:nSTAND1 domain-containing NTPase [Actinomadura terrae]|uniref:nSTAND1 domain-containing NTPase n=1 Tax=Actinomadura terrae TaxID=604353 RepID=UPI001FA733E5|nr:hypothetical protein [Actinomadura terrae]
MGRPEKPLDPTAGPIEQFAAALRELRNAAGRPAYRELARRSAVSATTLTVAARGNQLPTLKVALAFVEACGGDRSEWERRWHAAAVAVATAGSVDAGVGGDESEGSAPYLGLAGYGEQDADRFFGREELVADVMEQLGRSSVVAVAGPSGSGKSSLLRAGVIPAARRGLPAEPMARAVVLLTPGAAPMSALASALAGLDTDADPLRTSESGEVDLPTWARQTDEVPDGGLLVVVDQFEELFTLCVDPGQRTAFIDALLSARRPGSVVRVVLGLRADFFGHCAGHRELAAALRTGTVLVAPMSAAELREAIVKPAARTQVMVEPSLVATIIAEATGEPGMLPLVSHALRETWRRRRGRTLTLHAYRSTGGIHGAVAQSAEAVWATLSPAQKQIVRQVMLRLIAVDADGQATHRPLPYDDLPTGADTGRPTRDTGQVSDSRETDGPNGAGQGVIGGDVERVLERLAGARLVTLGRSEVRLAHEALITAWPRLREWLDHDRAGLRVHQQLTEATRTWRDLHRSHDALLRGLRLAIARDWAERDGNHTALTDDERAFLTAGHAAEQAERDTMRRRNRRLRMLSAALAILLLAAIATGTVAVRQGRLALARQHQAQSRELAGQARLASDSDPVAAIRLASEAYRYAPTAEARGSLLSIAANPRFQARLPRRETPFRAMAVSPDGLTLAVSADAGHAGHGAHVEVWNTRAGELLTVLDQAHAADSLAFSSDGRRLIAGSPAGDAFHAQVMVWDLPSRRPPTARIIPAASPVAVEFSADGHPLAAATTPAAPDRRPSRLPPLPPSTHVWDLSTTNPAPVTKPAAVPFSMLGGYSRDGRVRVQTIRRMDNGSEHTVPAAVVDTRTNQPIWVLDHHEKAKNIAGWLLSDDGRHLYLIDRSTNQIIIWDLPRGLRRAVPGGIDHGIDRLVASKDGRLLITVSAEGFIIGFVDLARPPFAGRTGAIDALTYSPDGGTLTAVRNSQLHLLDPTTHRVRGTLPIPQASTAPVRTVTYAPHGQLLAVSGHPPRSWRAASPPRHLDNPGGWTAGPEGGDVPFTACGTALAFNPRRGTEAACAEPTLLKILRVRSPSGTPQTDGTTIEHFIHAEDVFLSAAPQAIQSVSYTPDGHHLAILGSRGQLMLWDIRRATATPMPLTPLPPPRALAFSPDGRFMALAGNDRAVTLWDLKRNTVWATLTGHTQAITSLAFSPDSRTLASGSTDQTIINWPLSTTAALDQLRHPLGKTPP